MLKLQNIMKSYYRYMLSLKNNRVTLLWISTALTFTIIISFSAFLFLNLQNYDKLSSYGSFFGGSFTSLTLLWLITSTYLQNKSIKESIEENKKYHKSIELSMRVQRIDLLIKYSDIVIPLLYADCRLIIEICRSADLLANPAPPVLSDVFSQENLETLNHYLENNEELENSLKNLIRQPGSGLLKNTIGRIVARVDGYRSMIEEDENLKAAALFERSTSSFLSIYNIAKNLDLET